MRQAVTKCPGRRTQIGLWDSGRSLLPAAAADECFHLASSPLEIREVHPAPRVNLAVRYRVAPIVPTSLNVYNSYGMSWSLSMAMAFKALQ